MAESLLLPVVRAVAGKAADALVRSVTGMLGVDDDRSKLERQLLAVQCKLADAEVKSETNQYVKRWMKDFRTVAYEAGDVLDDIQYEALRREAQIGESTTRKMNRMRRIAGMGKTKVPSAVQKDKDESIVFFRELYKHEKDTDVNLLEPMYSVEFDAIQGGHMSKPPSARRDFLVPIAEKHDYDWLKTPPAASLFPSLEVEANSCKMKELPILRPMKPSSSRFLGRPEGTKKASPPTGSSPKNLFRGAPSISNEKKQVCTIDKRSAHTAVPSRQQKPAAVTARATTSTSRNSARATTATSSNSAKKPSDRCHAIQDSRANATETVQSPDVPYNAPKNLLTTGSVFARRGVPTTTVAKGRSGGPAFCADDKGGTVGSRRLPQCPPTATTRGFKEPQVASRKEALPAGSEPAYNNSGHVGTGEANGMRRADGKNKRRPRFADK